MKEVFYLLWSGVGTGEFRLKLRACFGQILNGRRGALDIARSPGIESSLEVQPGKQIVATLIVQETTRRFCLNEQARVHTMGRRSNVRGWFADVQPPELDEDELEQRIEVCIA